MASLYLSISNSFSISSLFQVNCSCLAMERMLKNVNNIENIKDQISLFQGTKDEPHVVKYL